MPLNKKDLAQIITETQSLEDAYVGKIRVLLEDARNDIVSAISTNQSVSRLDQLNTILDSIDERIIKLRIDFNLITDTATITAIEQGFLRGTFFRPTTAPQSMINIDTQLLKSLADYRADLIKNVTTDIHQKITEILRRRVITGDSISSVIKEVGSVLTDKGAFKTVAKRAETIVRYEYNRISSLANQTAMEDDLKYVPDLRKQWIATMMNTRQAHAEASGQIVHVTEQFIVSGERLMYPCDPIGSASNVVNCRCMSIPVVN